MNPEKPSTSPAPKEAPPRVIHVVPRRPPGRKLLLPVFQLGTEDPVYTPRQRRPAITWRSVVCSAAITLYTFYAAGDLPEVNAAFDALDRFLRARNDMLVNAILAVLPALGVLLFVFALVLYILLHYNRLRRFESDGGRTSTA